MFKTDGKIPTAVVKALKAYDAHGMVDEFTNEGEDGLWVYLRAGFINPDLGAHLYHEFSTADLVAALKTAPVPCGCAEVCRA